MREVLKVIINQNLVNMMTDKTNKNILRSHTEYPVSIPEIFKGKAFNINSQNRAVCNAAVSKINIISPYGLYIYGDAGTGKTHLAAWFITEWCLKNKTKDACFVNYPKIIYRMHCNITNEEGYENEKIMGSLATKELLVLDDLGSEKSSEWTNDRLYIVIDERYCRRKLTTIISNYGPTALAQKVGDRVVSRIFEMCDVYEITGVDQRVILNKARRNRENIMR